MVGEVVLGGREVVYVCGGGGGVEREGKCVGRISMAWGEPTKMRQPTKTKPSVPNILS